MTQEHMNTAKKEGTDPFEAHIAKFGANTPEGEALYKLYQQTFKAEQEPGRVPTPDPLFAGKILLYKQIGNPRSSLKVYFDGLGGNDVTHVDHEAELLKKLRAGNVKGVVFAFAKEEKSSIATLARVCGDPQTSYAPLIIVSYLEDDHAALEKILPQLLIDKHTPMSSSRTAFGTAFKEMLENAKDPLKSAKAALVHLQKLRKAYVEGSRSAEKKGELLAQAELPILANHEHVVVVLERIRVLLTVGDHDKAEKLIDQLYAKDPTLGALALLKAQHERLKHGADAGLAWINQEASKIKWNTESFFQLGQLFIKWKNTAGLLSIAAQLTELKNFAPTSEFFLLAAGYYKSIEDWSKYLVTTRILVHLEPLNGVHLSALGEAYYRAGDHRQAEVFLLAARQQKGANEAEIIAIQVKSSLKQKRMKFAQAMLADALKLYPDSPVLKALIPAVQIKAA